MRRIVRLSCLCVAVMVNASAVGQGPARHVVTVPRASDPSAGRWLRNLGADEALVRVEGDGERASTFPLRGGSLLRLRGAEASLSSDQPMAALVLSADLDVASVSFPGSSLAGGDPSESAWRDLTAAEREPGAVLSAGESAGQELGKALELEGWEPTSVLVTTALLDAGSSVEGRLVDTEGRVLRSWSVTASTPWSFGVGLGDLASARLPGCRIEVAVLAGRAYAAITGGVAATGSGYVPLLSSRVALDGSGGAATYSVKFSNATQPFTFRVSGAPPNVCGDIHTFRNGAWVVAYGWICTDSTGSATKGPWTCGQDQTDNPTYITWPDGSRTFSSIHVCDVIRPTVSVSVQSAGSSTFAGHADDGRWGSGFGTNAFGFVIPNPWGMVQVSFRDLTTGLFWNSASGCYCTTYPETKKALFNYNPPFWSTGWSVIAPPPGSHVSGHLYSWSAIAFDYLNYSLPAYLSFVQP